MAFIDGQRFAIERVPDADRFVVARGCEIAAITRRRPRDTVDLSGMSFVYAQGIAHAEGVPDVYHAISAARRDRLAVGRPRHCFYGSPVAAIGVDRLAG